MNSYALRLVAVIAALSPLSFAQIGPVTTTAHELPLLGIVGAGIIAGGVLSMLKTRHQK